MMKTHNNFEVERVDTPDSPVGGSRVLWRVSPPIIWDEDKVATDYVLTSAVVAMFTGAETYIFPCDSKGEPINWGELPGSYRGGLDHNEAIMNVNHYEKW